MSQLKQTYVFIFFLSILLVTPLLFSIASAQTGTGSLGLNLTPSIGQVGTQVTVSLTIDASNAYLYRDKNFSLVWDIGGWNEDNPAGWSAIQNTLQWEKIGSASWDISGHLTGSATLPNRVEVGHHIIYAISEQGIIGGSTMNFWWGFFEMLPGGAVTSLSPSPSPSQSPSPSPHPYYCTLIVNWSRSNFYVYVQGKRMEGNDSCSNIYPWGTIVHLSASYEGTDEDQAWEGWSIFDSKGRREGPGPYSIDLVMDEDKSAEPKTKRSGLGGDLFEGIPGFPLESIVIGLLLSLGLLYMAKKKSGAAISVPKQIFKPSS